MTFLVLFAILLFVAAKFFRPTSPAAMMVVQVRAAREAQRNG
jgi:hypothetical protein